MEPRSRMFCDWPATEPARHAVALAMDRLQSAEFAHASLPHVQFPRYVGNRLFVELRDAWGIWLAELREDGNDGAIVRVRLEPYNG